VNLVQAWNYSGTGKTLDSAVWLLALPPACLEHASCGRLRRWFIGHSFFYWWHVLRTRMDSGLYSIKSTLAFTNEIATSFYKHPVEILSDSISARSYCIPCWVFNDGALLVQLLCCHRRIISITQMSETPRWLRFFIQTPELHSIHHQYDVHRYNFQTFRLGSFVGTYKDATDFANRCGFPTGSRGEARSDVLASGRVLRRIRIGKLQ